MYNQSYFIPRYFAATTPNMMRGTVGAIGRSMGGAARGAGLAFQGTSRGLGLFSRLGSSMQAIKNINWGGLINGASKTLNIVNQAIPLVRQVGPMVNNMKSMIKVASIFKDETDRKAINKDLKNIRTNSNNSINNLDKNSNQSDNSNKKDEVYHNETYLDDNSPTFFINS